MASQGSSQGSRAASRTDPGWKYCHSLDENDTNTIVCNFCGKITRGGITRAKQHLMGKKGNVSACTKCPKEVREELWDLLRGKKKQESAEIASARNMDLENLGYGDSESEGEINEGFGEVVAKASHASGSKKLKGPIDLFCRQPETAIEKRKKERLRQTSIRETCDKETTARVHQYIARFWYQAGLSFNCIKLKSFHDMIAAISSFGPNLRAPSYHEIRVPLLKKEMEYTQSLLKGHKEHWDKHGCSLMSDAWTDRKQRCLINFLVNSPAGTMFVRSIDGSKFVKTGEKLFEFLDSLVEEIGEDKVVQVITDNGSNYVLAGKMLEEKRPHLYWTPCAAHCVDLMLEDIGKIPSIKKTIQRAIFLVGFIYSHSSTLSLLRHFTNKRELVRHAVTRFATSFLSLERLHREKTNIRRMFTSNEWTRNKLSKEVKGKQATKIVLMPSFWNHVVYTLKVMAPLVRVLRLADGERKPAMSYIYEAMDKAKEAIMKSFNNNESKYNEVFVIIDNRWTCQLHRPLHAAGHFLNPEFYYANPLLEFDLEVTNGLYECIKRLVPSREVQQKILIELPIYKASGGLFGTDFAISQRNTLAPAQWWRMYGHSAPNLQQLAIRILSLTCSASGCERNWSVFEQVWVYKKTSEEKFPTLKKYSDKAHPSANYATHEVKVGIEYKSTKDPDKFVPPEQRIKGYSYGPQVIPISSAEWDAVKFKPEKGVKLLGFTDASNILRHYYMKDVYIFIPEPGNAKATVAVSAIARGMKEMNKCAILRCVWRQGQGNVVIGLLTPNLSSVDNIPDSFYFNVLPFAEDVREFQFPSFSNFPSCQPDEQQQEVADDLVRMLDLAPSDTKEVLQADFTANPVLERFYRFLDLKSKNPEVDVPQLDRRLKRIAEPDPETFSRHKPIIDNFQKQFELKENPKKKKLTRRAWREKASASNEEEVGVNDGVPEVHSASLVKCSTSAKVEKVSDLNPVQDFEAMMARRDSSKWTRKAIKDMQDYIIDLLENSFDGNSYPKAIECLIALRKGCILEQEPKEFNQFLINMYKKWNTSDLADFLGLLPSKNITLISKSEAADSDLTEEEARNFPVKLEDSFE